MLQNRERGYTYSSPACRRNLHWSQSLRFPAIRDRCVCMWRSVSCVVCTQPSPAPTDKRLSSMRVLDTTRDMHATSSTETKAPRVSYESGSILAATEKRERVSRFGPPGWNTNQSILQYLDGRSRPDESCRQSPPVFRVVVRCTRCCFIEGSTDPSIDLVFT